MKKRKSIIKKIRRTMTKYFPYFVKKKKKLTYREKELIKSQVE